MPLACEQQQAIEFVQKHFRTSLFVAESFALCAPNFSLNRILLKPPKEVVESGTEVEYMKAKHVAFLNTGFSRQIYTQRANLDVFQFFSVKRTLQRTEHFLTLLGAFYKRLAVVGKGQ